MFNSLIYKAMEWITRFAYLQLLWITFTFLGFIAFGLFPSTTAAFSVVRRWLLGETDAPIFKTFSKYYKKEFLKSNFLGLFVSIGISLILFNLYFVDATTLNGLSTLHIILFAVILFYLIFIFYLFPSFVHFEGNIFKVMKNALLFLLISPLHTLLMALSITSLLIIFYTIPALAFIFGISSYTFITTWIGLKAFQKVNQTANS